MAIKKGKVVSFTSVKGGVGKTTTLLNVAGVLSDRKKKVLIIDADLYNGAIPVSLDVECDKDIYILTNDLATNKFDYLESYTKKYNDYIDIISSPKDPRDANKVLTKYLQTLIRKARMRYDVVLIDLNHIMDSNNLMLLDESDYIYYLITNDLADIKGIKTMISIYKNLNKDNYRIIYNEAKDKLQTVFSKNDVKNIIKDDINYIIPSSFYLRDINSYVLSGMILTLSKTIKSKYKKAIQVFEEIANEILLEGETDGEKETSK